MNVDRVVFLDVDGVLNRIDPETGGLLTLPAPGMEFPYWVELNVVRTLNAVFAQCTDTRLFISSTWRMGLGTPEQFVHHTSIDPCLLHEDWRTPPTEDWGEPDPRPKEVADWLSRHPEVTAWVAVDDTLFGFPQEHFIPVDGSLGLTYPLLRETLSVIGYTLDDAHGVKRRRARNVSARKATVPRK